MRRRGLDDPSQVLSRRPDGARRDFAGLVRGGLDAHRPVEPEENEKSPLNSTVPLALFGWPLVVLALCWLLPGRRAVVCAYVVAWLFLPVYEYKVPGLADWTKMSATSITLIIGVLFLDFGRVAAFRPRWFYGPIILWCLCGGASSLANGLGPYAGLSTVLDHIVVWGLPYFLGRLYFSDVEGLRDLALGLFIGGLAYIPFCLYEIRMSPQLHSIVYGFHQHSFSQTKRFG